MQKYRVTFMSSGAITVEAENEENAREIFETTMQETALRELELNGIDVTEVSEEDCP